MGSSLDFGACIDKNVVYGSSMHNLRSVCIIHSIECICRQSLCTLSLCTYLYCFTVRKKIYILFYFYLFIYFFSWKKFKIFHKCAYVYHYVHMYIHTYIHMKTLCFTPTKKREDDYVIIHKYLYMLQAGLPLLVKFYEKFSSCHYFQFLQKVFIYYQ